MKKFLLLLLVVIILGGCKANPKKLYNFSVGEDNPIIVGYDSPEVLEGLDYINDFSTFTDKKEREFLESIEIYADDANKYFMLDGQLLKESIKENCETLKGELSNKNGVSCVLHKTYKKKENVVILTGDILSDNIDKLDRIQIIYR